jgi:hypothetical protein
MVQADENREDQGTVQATCNLSCPSFYTAIQRHPSPFSAMRLAVGGFIPTCLVLSLLGLSSSFLLDPPTRADSNTVADCSNWILGTSGTSCDQIASSSGITSEDFTTVYVSNR